MRHGRASSDSCKTRIGLSELRLSELRLRRSLTVSERPRVVIYCLLIPLPVSANDVGKAPGHFLPARRAGFQSSQNFDPDAFLKYMHNFGMAYQNQATELITICRLLYHVTPQVLTQDAELTK